MKRCLHCGPCDPPYPLCVCGSKKVPQMDSRQRETKTKQNRRSISGWENMLTHIHIHDFPSFQRKQKNFRRKTKNTSEHCFKQGKPHDVSTKHKDITKQKPTSGEEPKKNTNNFRTQKTHMISTKKKGTKKKEEQKPPNTDGGQIALGSTRRSTCRAKATSPWYWASRTRRSPRRPATRRMGRTGEWSSMDGCGELKKPNWSSKMGCLGKWKETMVFPKPA